MPEGTTPGPGPAAGRKAGLTIRDLTTTAVEVPMTYPLGTSVAALRTAPLLLVDLRTEQGVTGHTYVFCYRRSGARAIAALIADMAELLRGRPAVPGDVAASLARTFGLFGTTGIARMALSAVDGVLWDAVARAAGLPLATLLGASLRAIPAYNSSGLGLMAPEAAADQAELLLARGFKALKLRLGHLDLAGDLAVTRAVRRRIPDTVAILADYNQGLDLPEALRRGRALQDEGLAWLEEPIRHDDHSGLARLRGAISLPIQVGENFNGPADLAAAIAAGACDLVMPDYARIGGVTGWLRAAGVAAAHGVPMSSHLFPEVSAHLLAATPTAHWLEYVDWADPILEEPIEIRGGEAIVPARPGAGIAWNRAMVETLRIA